MGKGNDPNCTAGFLPMLAADDRIAAAAPTREIYDSPAAYAAQVWEHGPFGAPSSAASASERARWRRMRMMTALDEFLVGRDRWPRSREFRQAGLDNLYVALSREAPMDEWARRFGLASAREPIPDVQLHRRLTPIMEGRDTWPTGEEFLAAGEGAVHRQISAQGTARSWAQRFGVTLARAARDDDQLASDIREFLAGREVWPKQKEWVQGGALQLLKLVYDRGGPSVWADRIGVRLPATVTRRHAWDEPEIERELGVLIARHSGWPSQADFKDGHSGLYQAMRKHGGAQYWAQRMGVALGSRQRRWTPETIEATLRELAASTGSYPSISKMDEMSPGLSHAAARQGGHDLWASKLGMPRPVGSGRSGGR